MEPEPRPAEADDDRRFSRRHLRRALARRTDELADLIQRENGKPRYDALSECLLAVSHLHHAAVRARRALATRRVASGLLFHLRSTVSHPPLGVVAVIGPWNYPLFTPMGSIAYALAAGNAVVFKPSELTPLVGRLLGEIAADALPVPHVLQVVTGDGRTGAALARARVDKIAFTGSTATGRRVMAAAAENLTPVLLELGGKDPLIVAADADVDAAARAAVYGAMANAGQACIAIERAYVVDALHDRFVERVVAAARELRTGAGDDAQIGAITLPAQIAIIRAHVEDALARGAAACVGGPEAIGERFVAPIVLTGVTPDMRVMREETFGPVLPIARVASVEEALRLANDSPFGLGSAVFGRDRVRAAADALRCGMTSVNSVLTYAAVAGLPFGGVAESGFGRIHGDEGLREFTRTKATVEQRFTPPWDLASFAPPARAAEKVRGLIRQLYGGGLVDRATSALRRWF